MIIRGILLAIFTYFEATCAEKKVLKSMDDWKGTPSVSGSFTPPKNRVASNRIGSVEDWEELKSTGRTLIVGFFTDWKEGNGQTFLQAVVDIATNFDIEYRFCHCQYDPMIEEYGDGSVIVFRPEAMASDFEESMVRLDDDSEWTFEGVQAFIKDNVYGLCPIATKISFPDLPRPLAVVLDPDFDVESEAGKRTREVLLGIQEEFAGDMNVAVAKLTNEVEHLSKMFPLTASGAIDRTQPFLVIYEEGKTHKVMDGVFNPAEPNARDFIHAYVEQQLEAEYTKDEKPTSEEVEKPQDEPVADEKPETEEAEADEPAPEVKDEL